MMRRIKNLINKHTSSTSSAKNTGSGPSEEKSMSGAPPREMMGYYIGPTLGQGHFARVKLGVNKKTGEKAALKLIVKDAIGEESPEFRSVQREIDALSKVRHENVLRLHAVEWNAKFPRGNEQYEDVAAIILELAEGGEMFDFLCYTGAMDELVARSYFHQLIKGLEECHAKGVIHRDLKLENILLTADYTLKIADFGLAELNVFSDKTKMSTWCGTKRYMAPELHENRKYTLKVDIFACGIILFILLGGYPPFVYATKEDDLYKYLYINNFNGFWKKHASYDKATFSDEVKTLLNGMFACNETERFTIQQIKESDWFNGPVLSKEDLSADLARRKAAVDAAKTKAKSKDKSKEKKVSKLSRLDTVNQSADVAENSAKQRDFFTGAQLSGDYNCTSMAEPKLWDEEEMGVAIFTKFKTKSSAESIYSTLINMLQSVRQKYTPDEDNFKITATLQDFETFNSDGECEEIKVSFQVFQSPEPEFRHVLVRRIEGDSFVFQRFYEELTILLENKIDG